MRDSVKTFSIAAISAFVVIGVYSFRPLPDEHIPGKLVIYEYMQFSTVESVVPGGLGRSRILTTDNSGQVVEKELKNFYSMVGINFGNIANNDRTIVSRLNDYATDGWELYQVTTGTNEQMSNGSSSGGLFISRYMLRRVRRPD